MIRNPSFSSILDDPSGKQTTAEEEAAKILAANPAIIAQFAAAQSVSKTQRSASFISQANPWSRPEDEAVATERASRLAEKAEAAKNDTAVIKTPSRRWWPENTTTQQTTKPVIPKASDYAISTNNPASSTTSSSTAVSSGGDTGSAANPFGSGGSGNDNKSSIDKGIAANPFGLGGAKQQAEAVPTPPPPPPLPFAPPHELVPVQSRIREWNSKSTTRASFGGAINPFGNDDNGVL